MKTKYKLLNNEVTVGSWIMMSDIVSAEIIAQLGFDWLVLDYEHTSLGLKDMQILMSVIQSKGIDVFVRVSKNEEVCIKKVLDMGADGIIVPMVKTKEDAEKAVQYAKYPNTGSRGVGLYRASNYGMNFEEYKNKVNDEVVIIAQIEHIEAVENFEKILTVDDIDGYIIGPYDLSGSLGCPGDFDNNKVKESIKRVLELSKLNKKPVGFHVVDTNVESVNLKIKEGCNFVAYGIDYMFLRDMIISQMKGLKK